MQTQPTIISGFITRAIITDRFCEFFSNCGGSEWPQKYLPAKEGEKKILYPARFISRVHQRVSNEENAL